MSLQQASGVPACRPDEPLLHRQRQPEAAQLGPGQAAAVRDESFPWLTTVGFGLLTFNSGMALYRSKGDAGAISFVVFSYLDLLLLFYFLRRYERTDADSPHRNHLKVAVWVLTTALTLLFSYKVAAIMPMAVAILVWAMAVATVAGGFFAFFCYKEK